MVHATMRAPLSRHRRMLLYSLMMVEVEGKGMW